MSFKIEKADESTYLMLLNKIFGNLEEERNLALDRYRKADAMMVDQNHFMLLGKNCIAYLNQASDITNAMINVSKDIKSIVFKSSDNPMAIASGSQDQMLKQISDLVKKEKEANPAATDEDDD